KIIIRNNINQKPQACENYMDYFSVSAQVWKKSTAMSLHKIFNDNSKMFVSPKNKEVTGARYTKTQLKPKMHFINCHGAKTDPVFYGQRGHTNYPEALKSEMIEKRITSNTVIAAECCYGAEMYDPSFRQPENMSI